MLQEAEEFMKLLGTYQQHGRVFARLAYGSEQVGACGPGRGMLCPTRHDVFAFMCGMHSAALGQSRRPSAVPPPSVRMSLHITPCLLLG